LVLLTSDIVIFSKPQVNEAQLDVLGVMLILLVIIAMMCSCIGFVLKIKGKFGKRSQGANDQVISNLKEGNKPIESLFSSSTNTIPVAPLDRLDWTLHKAQAMERIEVLFSVHGLQQMKEWADHIEKGHKPPKE
jgi:hypothetical protein